MATVQAEKTLWKWGPLGAGLYGEALVGLAGKTTGEWLPGEETISSGGLSGALGAGLKILPIKNKYGLYHQPCLRARSAVHRALL
jgi:hypothetical protein